MGDGPYLRLEDLKTVVQSKASSEDPFYFAVIDNKTEKIVGYVTLMRIDTKNRIVEVGNVMFSPLLQRSRASTETHYLLAKYVFDQLGYRRYEWKCDNFNTPSKRAAIRLGFTFEGIFRQGMIYKNRSRDTAWFSIIDSDWPVVKSGFESWLNDVNFDEAGKQVRRLEDCRQQLPNQKGPVSTTYE
jgi:RimJ/RimL family protein N-acetyltransferase